MNLLRFCLNLVVGVSLVWGLAGIGDLSTHLTVSALVQSDLVGVAPVKIKALRLAGKFAVVEWIIGNSRGSALVAKNPDWRLVQNGGGRMGYAQLQAMGVPPADWYKLLGS